jgi:hypothetical protein
MGSAIECFEGAGRWGCLGVMLSLLSLHMWDELACLRVSVHCAACPPESHKLVEHNCMSCSMVKVIGMKKHSHRHGKDQQGVTLPSLAWPHALSHMCRCCRCPPLPFCPCQDLQRPPGPQVRLLHDCRGRNRGSHCAKGRRQQQLTIMANWPEAQVNSVHAACHDNAHSCLLTPACVMPF